MEKGQSDVSLAQWFGSLRAMIEGGTRVAIKDEESRSGGTGTTAWSFSRQKLSWSKVEGDEPFATATWYTTEVWERRDGDWTLVHVHHSTAASPDPAEE
jgi:hypothetical protein